MLCTGALNARAPVAPACTSPAHTMLAAQPTWRALGRSAHRLAAGRAVAARAGIVATVAASIVATSGGGGAAAATAALALATPVALVAPGKAAG